VKEGLHDVVTPFEKWEPHPERKSRLGKWRIVNCLSVVDQIIERVILGPAIEEVKYRYPSSGAVIGIGFSDEHSTKFANEVDRTSAVTGVDGKSTDVAGWERTLDRSYIQMDAEMIAGRLKNPKQHRNLIRLIRLHALMITNPLFLVPNMTDNVYELVARSVPGGMLSGSFLTTMYNTLARLDVSYLAGSLASKASGDDCLEWSKYTEEEMVSEYKALGYELRDITPINQDEFHYCSHTMYREGGGFVSALDSWVKALYTALSKPITLEREAGFKFEVRHNKNRDALIKALSDFGTFASEGMVVEDGDITTKSFN
jgi:hypothetical protein